MNDEEKKILEKEREQEKEKGKFMHITCPKCFFLNPIPKLPFDKEDVRKALFQLDPRMPRHLNASLILLKLIDYMELLQSKYGI